MGLTVDKVFGPMIHNHKGEDITGGTVGGVTPVDGVNFNTAYVPTGSEPVGALYWNETDKTLDLVGDGTTLQIGQELYVRVRNNSGAAMSDGNVVYISGQTGIFPDVELALADAEATSKVLGVVTEPIASPAFGFVTTTGYVRGIKTDYTGAGIWGTTWAAGDLLYVSKTTAGQLTNVEPTATHHSDVVGTVGVVHAAQGTILLAIDRHRTLGELSDINGTTPTQGSIIVYDGTNTYWDASNTIAVPTTTKTALTLQTTDDSATNNLTEWQNSSGTVLTNITATGRLDGYILQDTQNNILNTTPTGNTIAVSNDTDYIFFYDGTNWQQTAIKVTDNTNTVPDMGAYQDSSPAGYGSDYVTDKTLSNVKVGSNANTTVGSIRDSSGTFQWYDGDSWDDVVTGFRFREDSTGKYELEHKPIGFSQWYEVMSGNGNLLDIYGFPLIQQYSSDMGAYSTKLTLDGGNFTDNF